MDEKTSIGFEAGTLELLWDSLKRDPDHHDRRLTRWGSKTKVGLIACVTELAQRGLADRVCENCGCLGFAKAD